MSEETPKVNDELILKLTIQFMKILNENEVEVQDALSLAASFCGMIIVNTIPEEHRFLNEKSKSYVTEISKVLHEVLIDTVHTYLKTQTKP